MAPKRAPFRVGASTIASLKIGRLAEPVLAGFGFTDYFAQGLNFRTPGELVLVDLRQPPGGTSPWATWLVVLSRFGDWSHFRLVAPLWRDAGERAKFVKYATKTYAPSPDAVALDKRIAELSHRWLASAPFDACAPHVGDDDAAAN